MKDTKINFPIIALGYGKVDSKGELLNVHFENIVSKTSEEYDSVASQDISKNIDIRGKYQKLLRTESYISSGLCCLRYSMVTLNIGFF